MTDNDLISACLELAPKTTDRNFCTLPKLRYEEDTSGVLHHFRPLAGLMTSACLFTGFAICLLAIQLLLPVKKLLIQKGLLICAIVLFTLSGKQDAKHVLNPYLSNWKSKHVLNQDLNLCPNYDVLIAR